MLPVFANQRSPGNAITRHHAFKLLPIEWSIILSHITGKHFPLQTAVCDHYILVYSNAGHHTYNLTQLPVSNAFLHTFTLHRSPTSPTMAVPRPVSYRAWNTWWDPVPTVLTQLESCDSEVNEEMKREYKLRMPQHSSRYRRKVGYSELIS